MAHFLKFWHQFNNNDKLANIMPSGQILQCKIVNYYFLSTKLVIWKCAGPASSSRWHRSQLSVTDLPPEVQLRILAYACEDEYRDVGVDVEFTADYEIRNRLLCTCSAWRNLISDCALDFRRWQRRARYLSKLNTLLLIFSHCLFSVVALLCIREFVRTKV